MTAESTMLEAAKLLAGVLNENRDLAGDPWYDELLLSYEGLVRSLGLMLGDIDKELRDSLCGLR